MPQHPGRIKEIGAIRLEKVRKKEGEGGRRRLQGDKRRCRLIGEGVLLIFEHGSPTLSGFDLRFDL